MKKTTNRFSKRIRGVKRMGTINITGTFDDGLPLKKRTPAEVQDAEYYRTVKDFGTAEIERIAKQTQGGLNEAEHIVKEMETALKSAREEARLLGRRVEVLRTLMDRRSRIL